MKFLILPVFLLFLSGCTTIPQPPIPQNTEKNTETAQTPSLDLYEPFEGNDQKDDLETKIETETPPQAPHTEEEKTEDISPVIPPQEPKIEENPASDQPQINEIEEPQNEQSQELNTSDIPDAITTLENDGRFYIFLSLLTEAQLLPALQEEGITLFAPLDESILHFIEQDPFKGQEELLTFVLLSHFIDGVLLPEELVEIDAITPFSNLPMLTSFTGESLILNDHTNVLLPTIESKNALIYPVDNLLFPPIPTE